jgi:O-antigen ligase
LFLNKNLLGEAAALGFIAAIGYRQWPAALLTIPALLLSTSRASMLAVTVGLILMTRSWLRYSLLASLVAALYVLYSAGLFDSASLVQRLYMWQQAFDQLKWFGNGSYELIAPTWRETHLHNDWLQLVFELGIFGLIPLAVLYDAGKANAPFVIALLVIGFFGFPLQAPATAWFGAFVVGAAVRSSIAQRRILLQASVAPSLHRRYDHREPDISFPVLR